MVPSTVGIAQPRKNNVIQIAKSFTGSQDVVAALRTSFPLRLQAHWQPRLEGRPALVPAPGCIGSPSGDQVGANLNVSSKPDEC